MSRTARLRSFLMNGLVFFPPAHPTVFFNMPLGALYVGAGKFIVPVAFGAKSA